MSGTGTQLRDVSGSLEAAFSARGVCVVGASQRQWSYGLRTIENLIRHGYDGPIVPVNPRYISIAGLDCVPSVSDLPQGACELAIVLTRPEGLSELLGELGESGVRAALVFSSPPPGRPMRAEIRDAVAASGVRVLGFGASLISSRRNLVAGAFSAAWAGGIVDGPVAVISQSGGVAGSVLNHFLDGGIGFRWMASVGSAVDVSVPDVMRWMREQDELAALGIFLEGEMRGGELVEELVALDAAGVRVVAMKIGASETARQVAATHTGTATGDDRVWAEVFRQCGAISVDEVTDMCSLLDGFARARRAMRPATGEPGRGVVAISVGSAGAAALAADSLARAGVTMLDYSEEEKAEIAALIPTGESLNPLDLAGVKGLPGEEVDALRDVLELVSRSPRVSGILVILPAMGYEAPAAQVVGEASYAAAKPLAVAWLAGSMADPGRLLLRRLGVPTFERIGLAARFLSELTGPAPAPGAAVALNPGLLEPEATFRLLASAGILAPARVVLSLEELERLRSPLEGLSGPWVVKLDATGIAHKANLGGVLLRQEPGEAVVDGVRRAAERMRALGAPPAMLVVEELVSAEVELLVSVLNDETFGLVCALGLGGVRADRLAKPALSLGVPTGAEVVRLLESSGAIDDLMRADLDRDAVADELSAVYGALSQLVNHPAPSDPALRLIELNPVAVTRDPRRRIVALDATVVTARAQSASGQREVGA